jgi:hypothetical protein
MLDKGFTWGKAYRAFWRLKPKVTYWIYLTGKQCWT